ncbi:hypothetical protein [Jannaschia rubra]|uniref:Uncharacterized protein n=1 Tax=Jannaschia rubra TaxID=282197 RepID=A0A0M6XT78_9RHOB|nr:hypothetical protein [Jannaschia rubra]CTQ33375.1 hypothetical protein JAN5088_02157 [Jannaschia rubra]SFG00290.1 hypothetical protein SAMN04488517_102203 [Jannaschia rubra]
MSKEWIIDVLGDLRGFAQANAMPTLAAQLDESIMVAATEIAQTSPIKGWPNVAETGRCVGTPG